MSVKVTGENGIFEWDIRMREEHVKGSVSNMRIPKDPVVIRDRSSKTFRMRIDCGHVPKITALLFEIEDDGRGFFRADLYCTECNKEFVLVWTCFNPLSNGSTSKLEDEL